MNELNGANKRAALAAHQGTDKWFAVGDKLAEQALPSTPDTRELATITARRARRAERIGIAAGLLTLALVVLVVLLGHWRSGGASGVVTAAVSVPPAAPVPAAVTVAAPAPPVAAPAPPVAAPAPTPAVEASAAPASLARGKHSKAAHTTRAPRRR